MLAADVTRQDWVQALPQTTFSHVIFCAAPKHREAQAYRSTYVDALGQVIAGIKQHQRLTPRLILTSSTGVYDEDGGAWVNERSPTPSSSERIATLLAAEHLVLDAGWPGSCVLRLGGIWGPGRDRLMRLAQKTPLPWRPQPHFSNHIHQADCAASVVHVATLRDPAACYVACDGEPVDVNALLLQLARACGNRAADGAVLPKGSPHGKRCDSTKLRETGFAFHYRRYADA